MNKQTIILIGATGTIGKAVHALLAETYDVIPVGYESGEHRVDLGSQASIEALFSAIGAFDHIVSTAGDAKLGRLEDITDADFSRGLENKLLGQMNLVRIGRKHVADDGSITLTSGLMATEPWPGTSATAAANAGLNGFVKAASLESERGLRVNAVSPIFVRETALRMGMGTEGTLSAAHTARAYAATIEGSMNGEVIDVRSHA